MWDYWVNSSRSLFLVSNNASINSLGTLSLCVQVEVGLTLVKNLKTASTANSFLSFLRKREGGALCLRPIVSHLRITMVTTMSGRETLPPSTTCAGCSMRTTTTRWLTASSMSGHYWHVCTCVGAREANAGLGGVSLTVQASEEQQRTFVTHWRKAEGIVIVSPP